MFTGKAKEIKDLLESIHVGTTYDKNYLIRIENEPNSNSNLYRFYFAHNEYYLYKDWVSIYYVTERNDGEKIKDSKEMSRQDVDNLITKLKIVKTFKNPVGATEPQFIKMYDPSTGKSFWRYVLDYMKTEEENGPEKDIEDIKLANHYNLKNMANNFDPSVAPDLSEEEKNYIKSLAGIDKFNMFELKTFETFDFEENKDDAIQLWLESNNFYQEAGGLWSTDSMFTITVPDFLVSNEGKLKIKFGKIGGNFELNDLELQTLEGSPYHVIGDFECIKTKIRNLNHLPNDIEGGLFLSYNSLTQIEDLKNSNIKGYINVSHNKLTSLDGCPYTVNGSFKCNSNELVNLDGCPGEVKGMFDCSNNMLTSLYGAPRMIKGELKMKDIGSVPETEEEFYKKFKGYENYYEDLLHWIINNDRIEKDLDSIHWSEEFLKSKGNIIRSINGMNKFNLGLNLKSDL